jgi:hypothetical protein
MISWTRGCIQIWAASPCWGKSKKQLQLKGNTAICWGNQQFWPPFIICQIYLTSQFQLNWWTEEQNTTHKPTTWWDHIKASAYMPIPGLDARRVTPELKLRLKSYPSWTWWGFLLLLLLLFICLFWFHFFSLWCFMGFVCFVIVGFLFLFLFLLSFFSFYTINFTIIIFSIPLLPPSLSLLLLC